MAAMKCNEVLLHAAEPPPLGGGSVRFSGLSGASRTVPLGVALRATSYRPPRVLFFRLRDSSWPGQADRLVNMIWTHTSRGSLISQVPSFGVPYFRFSV